MSCQIKAIANLVDPIDVKERLLGSAGTKFDHVPPNELPLQDILISLSSSGDVLATAWNRNVVVLTSKWDSQETDEVKNKFHITWSGSQSKEQNEWITCLMCLPLTSLGKASATNGPDWTCVAIGYSTGFLRFFTETGALLLEEQLHNEAILGIKCQSHSTPRHMGDTGSSEEIHVSYSSAVCVLQGFALFSTLRACRNHLARVQANCNDKSPAASLTYKKWGFKNQDVTNDCEVIGTTSVNTFDHLVTASICGGYHAAYRSSAPQHSLVMATGKRPFIGFHYALEGGNAPVLSDVAIAMASKLASAIGTAVPWFRGGSKLPTSPEKTKGPASEPAEAMTCRFGLSDVTREGDCITVSPNKMLSVVSDAMGRVILVDNRRGIAVRMWKGYRDAQCGWIEVMEERDRGVHNSQAKSVSRNASSRQQRAALFLIIYAPRKGVIDIWGIQQGAKITTFSASKNGRLLYTNYGLLGLSDANVSPANRAQFPCVFMDPLGGLKEITVPFHFALSSKNGKRVRDLHLLKKLKTFIRLEEFDEKKLIDEVISTCRDLKTNEIRLQIIEMLMINKHVTPDALMAAACCFEEKLEQHEEEKLEPVARALYQTSTQLQRAIVFYKYLQLQCKKPPEYEAISVDSTPSGSQLSSFLMTSERDARRILKLSGTLSELDRSKKSKILTKVTFQESTRMFLDFLSCFEFGTKSSFCLQKNVSADKKYEVSKLIYQGCMYSNDSVANWQEVAARSNIQPSAMMHLALVYWLSKRIAAPIEMELQRFTQILRAVCSLAPVEEVCSEDNEISSWWRDVRTTLTDSTNPFQALTAVVMCRAVATTIEKNKDKVRNDEATDDNGNEGEDSRNGNGADKMEESEDKEVVGTTPENENYSSTSEWEYVSKDGCQFTLLIGYLEDVAVLNAIVSQEPPSDHTTKFFAAPFEPVDISLGMILTKGRGSVSEIVARWLSSSGLDPARLIDTTDVEFDRMQLSVDSLEMAGSLDEAAAVELSRQDQTKLLSVCVDIGSEAKTDASAQAYLLDKITLLKRHFPYSLTSSVLLANLCWEFVILWNKGVAQLEALEAALAVLRHIPMKHIRHGVCCLLWTLHTKTRMESAAKLMNKLGKLPKERLCMQDVGLSDIQLTTLLQHTVTFLDIFLDVRDTYTAMGAEVLESEDSAIIKSEELWEGSPTGPQPFAALAISQAPASYDLVMLHLQLANVLHMMAHFNLKTNKPLNTLFDSVAHPYFFQDITDKVMLTWYRDDKRDNARMEFLCRVITASMDSIHQETTDGNNLSSTQAVFWMSKCQTLASIWKINNDELSIHQVCQLYVNGFDRLAEEVVTAVNDVERLASNLLPIAGRRMMAYLLKSPDLLEEVSRISPALTKYLESLNLLGTVFTNCSNGNTVELIQRVVRHLPESHPDYHLAQLMLEATFIYEGKT